MFQAVVSFVFCFYPYFGEMIQFDEHFSNGLRPPTSVSFEVSWGGW